MAAKSKRTAKQRAETKRWVKALKSGDYKKGLGELGNAKVGFCCLGVGAKVTDTPFKRGAGDSEPFAEKVGLASANGNFILTKKMIKIIDGSPGYNEEKPALFAKWVVPGGCYSLIELNDCAKLPFDVIAEIIESEPKGLFI